jgi:hypothetical protein
VRHGMKRSSPILHGKRPSLMASCLTASSDLKVALSKCGDAIGLRREPSTVGGVH